ncbi:phenylacetate--CoA ligase family protein [Pseudoalteromonas ruthenica]|uniref:phenylacetate--CoA ligase family protein n=1 Tax=Pseudoalteromonas ruthenica TaxID=151081 RepID=UPI000345F032|nr:phenylacetate--CoA ligase family protein [Pseudoalteromonas ruthenica]
MYTSRMYKRSPIWLQNVLASVYGGLRQKLRDNRHTRSLTAQLEQLQYDVHKCDAYRQARLKKMLTHAARRVPFYRDKGTDLGQYSVIDKATVKAQHRDFLDSEHQGVKIKGATSGTTGSPLVIYQSKESVMRERAFTNRHRQWAGYQKGDKRAWLRGDMIVPGEQRKAPFWRYSWFEDMIMLSSFHLTTANMASYIDAMVEFGVDVIQAYPSSIVSLAKYLQSCDTYYPAPLKSVITSSESLSAEDRALIESRFKCKVFDWYGLFERVAAIANCEHGNYHLLNDYAEVELHHIDGNRYELIGSNLNNALFPLIRYRTGDFVQLSDEQSCPCGRHYPVISAIEGRQGDYLVAEQGQKVYVLNHIPKGVDGLLGCQFVQHRLGAVEVRVQIDDRRFDEHQRQQLISNTKERLGQSMQVKVTPVSQLEKTASGKVRQALCSIEE